MPAKVRALPKRLGEVRIPSRVMESFDEFSHLFHEKILHEAVLRAFERKRGPDAGRVTVRDLIRAIRKFGTLAIADLERSLESCENTHGRRQAS